MRIKTNLVKSINTVPNISDHEGAIVVDSAITPTINMKPQRTIHLFSKADWSSMHKEIELFSEHFLNSYYEHSLNDNWNSIKNAIFSSVEKHVPQRKASNKKKHPWITTDLIRKSRKKHRMFKKSRQTKNPGHIEKFKKFKKELQKEIKKAKTSYINQTVIQGLEEGNTKAFYKYIKSLRTDNLGLAPLKSGATLVTQPQEKAELLLNEFSSVFTKEELTSIPWLGPASAKIPPLGPNYQQ